MKVIYPVIFTDTPNNILIEVPDLQILTESNSEDEPKGTFGDAIVMAADAIGLKCADMKSVTEPSAATDESNSIFAADGWSTVLPIEVDLNDYKG